MVVVAGGHGRRGTTHTTTRAYLLLLLKWWTAVKQSNYLRVLVKQGKATHKVRWPRWLVFPRIDAGGSVQKGA